MTAEQASLTWKLRQGHSWLTASIVMPASSASRVGCDLLREFSQSARAARLTPRDLDVTEETRKFSYVSDWMCLHIRRLRT